MSVFKKIAKGLLVGGGTVLSLINPAIGAPLVVAGTKIKTGSSGKTNDVVSTYATNLSEMQDRVAGIEAGQRVSVHAGRTIDGTSAWLQQNWIYAAGAIALGYVLFGKKRR